MKTQTKQPLLDKMTLEDVNILTPLIIKMFTLKSSKDKILKTRQILDFINNKKTELGIINVMTSQRLQKIINYIRVNSLLPIISTSTGYYSSYDREDIMIMIEQFRGRIAAMQAAEDGMMYIITQQKIKEVKRREECSLGFIWDK